MTSLPAQNPLLTMGEYKFQDLCRELLAKENDLTSCSDYEERGVAQYGADLIADCADGISTVIGQCKCYKAFPPADFKAPSTDFLDHLETNWKPFNIKRFILFLACDTLKANQRAAIQEERRRFHEKGIIYEVWDRKFILEKLRPYPQIVQTYFLDAPGYWLENICKIQGGTAIQPPQANSVATLSISFAQAGKLTEIFSGKQTEELEGIKELHREGQWLEAAEKLSKMRDSKEEWAILDDSVKAKILKTIAANVINLKDDLEKAETLFSEALTIDPEGDHTLFKATLEYYKTGAEAALKTVESPKNTDELNQKIGFLLELNNSSAALELIENPPAGIKADTETKRLYALALFESGKTEEAWVKISEVEEEKPLWEMVRVVKAIIGYYSALSAAAFPAHPLSWAMPVLWQLVKRDDESLLRLRNAEKTFAAILESGSKRREQKLIFESFRLACLANDGERQMEAARYFQEIITENPAHPFALAWAQIRGFEFDQAASLAVLESKIGGDTDFLADTQMEDTIALLDIYLRTSEPAKARRLLEKTRSEFERVSGSAVYAFWKSRTAVAENKHDEALRLARSEKDRVVGRQIQAMILRDKYFRQKSNKKAFKTLIGYLEKCWNKTRDSRCLVELCYLNAENGHWNFIAENYEKFIEAAGTADAVRIAAYALNFTKKPTKCLQVLENYQNKFPDSTLPTELARLRINCFTQQGVYSKAVSEAEILHARQDTPESLLTLIDAQLQKGDVAGVTYNAQKILHLRDVEPKYILRVAKIAALEDAELAKKLWRRVKADILDSPELVRDALEIGFAVGLDGECRDLMAQMQFYASQKNTPFKVFSFKQTLQQMKKAMERGNRIQELYGKGRLPLHFLAGEGGYTLARMLHEMPQTTRREVDLRYRPKIFIRHGGRSMREGYFDVKPNARLYMDISAFMMAAELEILNEVEKMFAPIRVPGALSLALTAERQKLTRSHQIAEIDAHRRVLAALEKNAFELFSDINDLSAEDAKTYKTEIKKLRAEKVALFLRAKNEGAFVIEHLPLSDKNQKPYTLPEEFAANVINCRVVAESLLHYGLLGQNEFNTAIDELGIDGQKVIEPEILVAPNVKLYVDDYLVNALEKAGLLSGVCEHYSVFADSGYIERIKGEIEAFERDRQTDVWLRAAENRLSEGFVTETYIGISVEEKQIFESVGMPDNVDVDVVGELLQLAPQPDANIWIDDRTVNSHSHAAGIPIISVTDILDALRRHGQLTDDGYFDRLLKLRAGNYRYLPLTSEEILYHLRAAKIIDGEIVETNALSVLRRYAAACLLDKRNLQKPPMPKNSPNMFGEINFALEMTGTVSDSIIALWSEEEDLREAEIRADWLFENLFVGKFGVRRLLPSGAADGDGSHEMGVDFSELLAKAIAMSPVGKSMIDGQTRRQLYFDWLNQKFFVPRLKADPNIVASAARTLETIFNEQTQRGFEKNELALASRRINGELFLDLPKVISAEIKTNKTMLDWLGITFDDYFIIGKSRFFSAEFWIAAEKAMNGETVSISDDSSKTFQIKRGNDDEFLSIEVIEEATGKIEMMRFATLGLLFRRREKRIECLKNNRHWFDCDAETFEKEIEEIVSLSDVRSRLERTNAKINQSIAVYYRELLAKFETFWNQNKKASLEPEDLEKFPPAGLLRHYRLLPIYESESDFSQAIKNAAEKLPEEEGLAETIERLSHLPLKIPECVVNHLKNLSEEKRSELFEELIGVLRSPLCKIQLVDLILRSASGASDLLEKAKILVGEIYNDEQAAEDFSLFHAILRFVGEEFGYLRETDEWSLSVKLAMIWAHAGKLFNLLLPIFGNEAGFRRWFWNLHQHSSTIFGEKSEYLHDCLNPRKISRPELIIHGVAALWAGDQKEDLEFLDVFDQIKKAVVLKDEIPQLELFRATELQLNATGSIFGGDRAKVLSALFGEENWSGFSNAAIKKNVAEAIEALQQDQTKTHEWTSLSLLLGNSPIYPDLRENFAALVSHLNFAAMLDEDLQKSVKALTFIVSQVSMLNDEQREKCETWLLLLARKIADKPGTQKNRVINEEMIDFGYNLLEISLTLSFRARNAHASSEKFRELMLAMLGVWSEFGAIAEPAILKINSSLPLAQTQGLPEILLNIRASKPANVVFKIAARQVEENEEK